MGVLKIARLSDFMRIASKNYYSREHVLGCKGDFVTSPLISQIFGEIFAVWLVDNCHPQSKSVKLIELGPGDGTLACDILRTFQSLSSLHEKKVEYIFVENSESMVELQKAAVKRLPHKLCLWYDCISKIPFDTFDDSPVFFIAHEFFDSLPVRKFARRVDKRWEELHVKFNEANHTTTPLYLECSNSLSAFLDQKYQHLEMVELSPASWSYAELIGRKVRQCGGGLLFCDYGKFGPIENSLRVCSFYFS
jgi:NADH dehydrogenase [ubiquinone] 1 alpha subcomplex assembly factor 7